MKVKAFGDPSRLWQRSPLAIRIPQRINSIKTWMPGIKNWFEVYAGEEIDWVKPTVSASSTWPGVTAPTFDDSDEKLYLLDNKECLMISDERPDMEFAD